MGHEQNRSGTANKRGVSMCEPARYTYTYYSTEMGIDGLPTIILRSDMSSSRVGVCGARSGAPRT